MSTAWNASSYHRVSDPQFNWGRAVAAKLALRGDERVIDLGCGTGRLTHELAGRLPQGTLIGLDGSAEMLTQAHGHLADCRPPVRLVRALLPAIPFSNWADVVFSTATFHWVLDHPALFANVFAALKPGGVLMAQCGGAGNLARARAPVAEVMASEPFARHFLGWTPVWEFASDDVTAERLTAAGFTDVRTSLEDAPVTFDDEKSYREFVTTVVYRLHLGRLPEALRGLFMDELMERIRKSKPGFVLDYRRLNMWGRKGLTP